MRTLKSEFHSSHMTSFSINREGAHRAIEIYKHSPVWGVGTRNYRHASLAFARPGTESWAMSRLQAMCHYLQLLAEEGIGAFIYFLMIGVYFFEMSRGLIRADGRFQ